MERPLSIDSNALLWVGGWLAAVLALFAAGLRLPLQTRLGPWREHGSTRRRRPRSALGVAVLANVALHAARRPLRPDAREDLHAVGGGDARGRASSTREVARHLLLSLAGPARRGATRDVLEVMARRNPLLKVAAVDPDKEPTPARRTSGIRSTTPRSSRPTGAACWSQSTDETEIALGIQRVLREPRDHGLLPRRPRRAADGQFRVPHASRGRRRSQPRRRRRRRSSRCRATASGGCAARSRRRATKCGSSSSPPRDATCRATAPLVVRPARAPPSSRPRARALRAYLQRGGSALLPVRSRLRARARARARLIADLGVRFEQQVVVDPLSHYQTDPEMVAVTGYDQHPITRCGVADLLSRHPAPDHAAAGGRSAGRAAAVAAAATATRAPVAAGRSLAVAPAARRGRRATAATPPVAGLARAGRRRRGHARRRQPADARRRHRRRRFRQQLVLSLHGQQRPAVVGGSLAGARGAQHRRRRARSRAAPHRC